MKVTVIPIVFGALDTVTKGLIKRLKDLEVRGDQISEDHSNDSIIKIGQNTKKSSRGLRTLAVT